MGRGTNSSCTTLACLLSSLSWVLDFANLVPLILSVTPHEGKCDAILSENLHKAIRLATNLALNLCLEVRQLANVNLLASLGCRLALFLVLTEIRCVFLLASLIPRESPNLFIFRSHNNVAILIVGHGPNCLWKLDSLLTCAICPESDRAVVTTRNDLTGFETIDTENEATVAFEVHHMGAVK